ncbi:MAG TPA: hypothetical protein VHB97_08735 [Polyangia bacterium]|nr:hypothetical protein [Polyangia bacterium]
MPGEDACARCGLLVARWDGFAIADPTHPALEAPWQKLQETWNDDAAHSAFLELAATVDGLDVAAAKYRRRKLAMSDDAKAERGLQRAVTMAQTLYVARAQAERPPRAPIVLKIVGTMFAGLILLTAIYVVIVTFARAPDETRTRILPTQPPSAPMTTPRHQTSSAPPPASAAPSR